MTNKQTNSDLPDIVIATQSYEKWLADQIEVLPKGLAKKHENMASDEFVFLRATFYRWAQRFPSLCPEIADAPQLLCVGDLHVENFGTWRDIEGRLVWGVNDFDEAAKLPYTNDLVRLALSAKLSLEREKFAVIDWRDACAAIAEGYGDAMADAANDIKSVKPIVLAESHGWLAKIASDQALDPEKFWNSLKSQVTVLEHKRQLSASSLLADELPAGSENTSYKQREAGEGSLGRVRYVALSQWCGGHVAREGKALCPSAAYWAGTTTNKTIRYAQIIENAVRCSDPFVHVKRFNKQDWIIRRLSPFCRRVLMDSLTGNIDEKIFHAMGHETADVHLNQAKRCAAILEHFHSMGPGIEWLTSAVLQMEDALRIDFDIWAKHFNNQNRHVVATAG